MKWVVWLIVFTGLVGASILHLRDPSIFSKGWEVVQQGLGGGQSEETVSVPIYFYKETNDTDATGMVLCSRKGLVQVYRDLPLGHTLYDRVLLTLEGKLTDSERATGITTEFPLEGVELTDAYVQNGTAKIAIADAMAKTAGGACRSAVLWYQIEATALGFPGVQQVEYIPETLFQP